MNKVILIGNLCRDPELRTTPSGKSVASFSIATNESYTNKAGERVNDAEFHNIVAWGPKADLVSKYCVKGNKVAIIGKLSTSSWEKDGIKRYKTEIVLNDIEFLSSKPKTEIDTESINEQSVQTELPQEEEIRVEDVPF